MSKIKLLKAAAYYDDFLKKVYEPKYYDASKSYAYNHQSLMDTCFAWSDFWKTNLEKTGEFEAEEIVFNAELLQKKWAKEHGFAYTENWMQEIFVEQIKHAAPQIIVMQDMYQYHLFLKEIKKAVPSIKMIVGWDGILYHKKEVFENCDLILSCVEETCEFYRQFGFKTHYFKFGFEASILPKLKKIDPPYDVSFVGSLYLGTGYHGHRFQLLNDIRKKIDINLWLVSLGDWQLFSKTQIRRLIDFKFEQVYQIWQIGRKNKGMAFGKDMFEILHNSKITFNSHGDNSPEKAANMRLIEATGVGSCLLTDWKNNISDFFEPEKEIITYKNSAEAIDKILYYLDHGDELKKIALAGQQRTLSEYSYAQRMKELAVVFKEQLNS